MGSNFRKYLAVFLSASVILLTSGTAYANQQYNEVQEFGKWLEKGIINGYPDGNLHLDRKITRAEFIKIMNGTFGLVLKSKDLYADVSPNDWFASEIAKARSAGYIKGYPDNTIRPGNLITRQEACVIISRVFRLLPVSDSSSDFNDAADIGPYALDSVKALVERGIVACYNDGTFRPHTPVTRREILHMLNRAAGELFDLPGTYEGRNIEGNAVISKPEVILKNITVSGDLYLTPGIGEGTVILENVTVKGQTFIFGGGENSIHLINSTLIKIIIDKKEGKVRVTAEGTTVIKDTVLESDARLEENNLTMGSPGFQDIQISSLTPQNADVSFAGNFGSIDLHGMARVTIEGGTVEELNILSNAQSSIIDIVKAVVEEVVMNAPTSIKAGKDSKLLSVVANAIVDIEIQGGAIISKLVVNVDASGTVVTGSGQIQQLDTSHASVEVNGTIVSNSAEVKVDNGVVDTTPEPAASRSRSTTPSTPTSSNRAPVVVQSIPSQTLTLGDNDLMVDVSGTFRDDDGDTLLLSAVSSDPAKVTINISGMNLNVHPVSEGSVTVAVYADDGRGGSASTAFDVVITSANQAPIVLSSIPDQLIGGGIPANSIDLDTIFSDPDGDPLAYGVSLTNPSIISASISGSQLSMTPAQRGTTTVTIAADDGNGGTVETTFSVSTIELVAGGTLNINTKVGVTNIAIDLSTYFPLQTESQLSVISSNNARLTGKKLNLTPSSSIPETSWVVADNLKAVKVILTAEPQPQQTAYISEFVKGSGGRTAVQVFYNDNGTNSGTTVSGCQLDVYQYVVSTGQKKVLQIPLEYPFYVGMPCIILNSSFYDFFDVTTAWYYNYDGLMDVPGTNICALVLKKDGQIIDVVGDPNSTNPIFTSTGTIVRKSGILSGSAAFNLLGEWDQYPGDTFSPLGRHQP